MAAVETAVVTGDVGGEGSGSGDGVVRAETALIEMEVVRGAPSGGIFCEVCSVSGTARVRALHEMLTEHAPPFSSGPEMTFPEETSTALSVSQQDYRAYQFSTGRLHASRRTSPCSACKTPPC